MLAKHAYPRVRQSVIEQCPLLPWPFAIKLLMVRLQKRNSTSCKADSHQAINRSSFYRRATIVSYMAPTVKKVQSFAEKRLLLELTPRIMFNLQVECEEQNQADILFKSFINVLNKQLENEQSIAVRRVITRVREQLVSFMYQQQVAEIEFNLNSHLDINLSSKEIEQDLLGRLLSKQAQNNEAFNVKKEKSKSYLITRGYKRGFFWRLWHEFRNPSTGKRQSFNHTQAKPSAFMHVPSCTVAEISKTEVPGEPRFDDKQFSARPHLPMLDFLLSILSQDNLKTPAKSFTPDGILVITPPSNILKRMYAYSWISFNFEKLDDLRNGSEVEQRDFLDLIRSKRFCT